jgi:hypothetical protein|tara:strand:- start:107 stop:541 length:435 start_codon:yes stop_codon:yes gene_type:complete
MPGSIKLPIPILPTPLELPRINLEVPSAHIPGYKPMVIPPSDLERPEGVKAVETTEQPEPPKLEIPGIDIQLPLPTAEVVTTATYAAVAAVATTTLATPFFEQIKKKLQKFLQGKIDKWKENRKKKKTSLTESKENEESLKKSK